MRISSKMKGMVGAFLEKTGLIPRQSAAVVSHWDIECFDKDGKLKWTESIGNLVVDEGLNDILDVMFVADTQITTWYVGIFNNDYTVLAGNTYQTKGFTESTNYTESNRPTWTPGSVSGKSVDNSASKATFTMNTGETVWGAFLCGGTNAATKNDSTSGDANVLYCSAQFSSEKVVVTDDVLKVTVTLTSASV